MFIRTERLFLRPAWPEDSHELHAAIAHEAVVRNLTRAPWPYTLDDAQAFTARPHDRRHPQFLVTLPGARGSRVIGGTGLTRQDRGAELGYWITPEAWGRGYATEAASAVVRLARTLGHRELRARHFLDNPASGRVLEKVGLRVASRTIEHVQRIDGSAHPALSYVLRFDAPSDCDGAPGRGSPTQGKPCEADMQAA